MTTLYVAVGGVPGVPARFGEPLRAGAYGVGSVVAGLLAATAGYAFGRAGG